MNEPANLSQTGFPAAPGTYAPPYDTFSASSIDGVGGIAMPNASLTSMPTASYGGAGPGGFAMPQAPSSGYPNSGATMGFPSHEHNQAPPIRHDSYHNHTDHNPPYAPPYGASFNEAPSAWGGAPMPGQRPPPPQSWNQGEQRPPPPQSWNPPQPPPNQNGASYYPPGGY